MQTKTGAGEIGQASETDMAQAAAGLYHKLEHGSYLHNGKRRKIAGDVSKLMFAQDLTQQQRTLLADVRFRCAAVPGTQDIRVKIGRVGFWASVFYGNGIFMNVSPGERHNYLAIRMSRYRGDDPFVASSSANAQAQRSWIGQNRPSLEPSDDDTFEMEIPGYDLRRLVQPQDPLCAANAFFVQLRTILSTILGIRVCPDCPRCAESDNPCQDALGSIAELMGGIAGRTDAMFGATECQKSNGSLHFHLFAFVQRLHQYANPHEIAKRLEAGLNEASQLKQHLGEICCTTYPDAVALREEMPNLEANIPKYDETTECESTTDRQWGETKLGRIPRFFYDDAKGDNLLCFNALGDANVSAEIQSSLDADAALYKKAFKKHVQYFQSRCQHHIHRLDAKTKKRMVPNACRSAGRPNECKHEAPWTARMNEGPPLIICKALAKARGLRCSGPRNWLGAVLGTRNDEWVNGTMAGLCIAFSGSNTDVKPNDRLPIIAATHEKCCTRRCVKKHHTKRITQARKGRKVSRTDILEDT